MHLQKIIDFLGDDYYGKLEPDCVVWKKDNKEVTYNTATQSWTIQITVGDKVYQGKAGKIELAINMVENWNLD